MRVVIPGLSLEPAAARTLPDAEVRVMLADTDYSDLMIELWTDQTFAIVEHDIVVIPQMLTALEECAAPWCGYWYQVRDAVGWGLGCVRWRDTFVSAHSDMAQAWHGLRWDLLDGAVGTSMAAAGVPEIHRHYPDADHLHRY